MKSSIVALVIIMFIGVQQTQLQPVQYLFQQVQPVQPPQPQVVWLPYPYAGWGNIPWRVGLGLTRWNIWNGCGWFGRNGCTTNPRPFQPANPLVVQYALLSQKVMAAKAAAIAQATAAAQAAAKQPAVSGQVASRMKALGKRSIEAIVPVNCIFTESNKTLECHGFNRSGECTAFRMGENVPFTYFAISSIPSAGSKTKPEEMKFPLYPQNQNKTGFLDTHVVDSLTTKSHTYSIFHAQQYTDSGIRIENPMCWEKMFGTFNEVVHLTTLESISVLKEDGSMEKVSIIGSLLLK